MAKLIKMTMIFTDIDDEYDEQEIMQEIENAGYFRFPPAVLLKSTTSKQFEWDDDLIINKCDTPPEEYEKFFVEVGEDNEETT